MPLPSSDYASLIEPTWLTTFTSIESPWLAIIRHSAPDLGINLPIALTQYLQNDLLVSC